MQNANARSPAEGLEAHYERFANLQQQQQQATEEKKNPGQKGGLNQQQQLIQQKMAMQHATAQAAAENNISGQQGQMNPQQMHNLQQAAQQQQQHQWQAFSSEIYEGSRESGARPPQSDYAALQPTEIDMDPNVWPPSMSISKYYNSRAGLGDGNEQPAQQGFRSSHPRDVPLGPESAVFSQMQDQGNWHSRPPSTTDSKTHSRPSEIFALSSPNESGITSGPTPGGAYLSDMKSDEVQQQNREQETPLMNATQQIQDVIYLTIKQQTELLTGWQANVPTQERVSFIFSM